MSILAVIFRGLAQLLLRPTSLLILLILVGLAGGYFYNESRVANRRLSEFSDGNPNQEAVIQEIDNLVEEVSKVTELPAGERPVVANIPTQEVLDGVAGQEFYKDAQIGDRALIYPAAGRAFLYRPTTQKIINISPVTINQQAENVGPSTEPIADNEPTDLIDLESESLRIVFYNGTSVAGITTQAFNDIAEALPDIQFNLESRGDASTSYSNTSVVNLTDVHYETIQAIASALGGSESSLPDGEVEPDGDILVIVGSSYTQE